MPGVCTFRVVRGEGCARAEPCAPKPERAYGSFTCTALLLLREGAEEMLAPEAARARYSWCASTGCSAKRTPVQRRTDSTPLLSCCPTMVRGMGLQQRRAGEPGCAGDSHRNRTRYDQSSTEPDGQQRSEFVRCIDPRCNTGTLTLHRGMSTSHSHSIRHACGVQRPAHCPG